MTKYSDFERLTYRFTSEEMSMMHFVRYIQFSHTYPSLFHNFQDRCKKFAKFYADGSRKLLYIWLSVLVAIHPSNFADALY